MPFGCKCEVLAIPGGIESLIIKRVDTRARRKPEQAWISLITSYKGAVQSRPRIGVSQQSLDTARTALFSNVFAIAVVVTSSFF